MNDEKQAQRGSLSIWRHRDGGHVELHVMPLDERQSVVVALAGRAGAGEPDRVRLQGPFPGRESALGVSNGVATALQQRGYHPAELLPSWQMVAWRERRRLLRERSGNRPDTRFHPDDVLFWPR